MSALKRIQHKNWDKLRDLWIEHLPSIEFDAAYPSPILQEFQGIETPQFNPSGTADVGYINGLREAVFREGLITSRKFAHCAKLLPILTDTGRNTWTAMGAYEASFYAAKSVVLILGIAPLNKDSKIFVDAFFETEIKQGKTKVPNYDILRFHKLDDRLTHKVLWPLLSRLLETTTFSDVYHSTIRDLKLIDWEKFSKFRNAVFYDSAFWPNNEKYEECDLVAPVALSDMKDAARLKPGRAGAPFAEDYFKVASLLRDLLLGLFESLSKIDRSMESEVECLQSI